MSGTRYWDKHYATAQVGKDTIENAEYFTFDSSVSNRPKRKLSFKDKVFNIWIKISHPFRILIGDTKHIYYTARFGFQRMFKCYDKVEIFDIPNVFVKRYSKILAEYKDKHWGYPYKVSSDEWENIIDTMIYHLYYMDSDNIEKELRRDVPENWKPSGKTVDEITDKHKDAFFELFSKYFYDLWD